MRTTHNLPLHPRIYLPFIYLYANLLESSFPSQNIPLFAKTIIVCDPPRIYPFFPEYNPLFNKFTCATLLESTTPSQNITPLFNTYKQPSQNLPPFSIPICEPPRIYPSFPEYTPVFKKFTCATLLESTPPSQNIDPLSNTYMQPSHNLPLPPRI